LFVRTSDAKLGDVHTTRLKVGVSLSDLIANALEIGEAALHTFHEPHRDHFSAQCSCIVDGADGGRC
jgi:hypothetical protein